MKKKFLLGVVLATLVGVMCVGLVGCGGRDSTDYEGNPFEGLLPEYRKSKLEAAYDAVYAVYGSSIYYEMGEDKSYISIDTNPLNIDDYYVQKAVDIVEMMNKELGLPGYIFQTMLTTTAMQGRQTMTANGITVSWAYHPDNGLEVMYIEA